MEVTKFDEAAALRNAEKIDAGNKKTVFLIGDSLRMGYCEVTKRELSKIAEVVFPEENCRYTQYTFINLAFWKNVFPDTSAVDAVYWNNGHWDIAHWDGDSECLNSISEYTKMLVRIYHKLKNYFPNAKIVFATTTPMNPENTSWLNWRTNDEIRAYNQAAAEVLRPLGVEIHDVFALLEDKPASFYADYCHLTDEGYDFLGKKVAECIRSFL